MHTFDIQERIKDINCKVLLLYGANDIFFPIEDAVGIMNDIGENA